MPASTLSPDEKFCQDLAEAFWAAATSENRNIAHYRSPVYRHLEIALISAIKITYGMTELKARRVRDLLAELGPFDGAYGTRDYGIKSYAQYVRENRGAI